MLFFKTAQRVVKKRTYITVVIIVHGRGIYAALMETEFLAQKIPNQLGVDACSRKPLRGTREAYAVKQLDEFAHKTGAL